MDRPLIAGLNTLAGRLVLAAAIVIAPTASAQTPPAPIPAATTRLESYAIPPAKQAEVIRWLETVDPSVSRRFAWDQRTGQLIVFATDDIHSKLAAFLEGKPLVAPVEITKPQAAGVEVKLTNATVDQVHTRIEAVVRRPLPKTWDPAEQWLSFPVRMDSAGGVEIKANPGTGQVLISGAPNEAAAWAKVVAAIDRSAAGEGVTQLVQTPSAQPAKVKAALAALAQPGEGAAPDGAAPNTGPTPTTPDGGAPSPQNGSQALGSAEEGSGQILGPVQVEFVEGLDIIIVRGNDEDVARVMEIINQIESLSQTTAPAIEVLPLQHVDSVLMARLLNRVYEQVLGARTGTVNVTPLGKPNSLLLIGRPENVQMAVELAKKLDQPVEAATRFEVFPLKHAAAEQAAELVNNFLGERADMENDDTPTLIPKALVVADVRSNSLVVSAGPRDIAEIRELLAKIDVGTAAAVDEVRVFPLRNTLATELETVLETAINPGTEGGDGETATRSAALQFIAIDAETKRRLQSGVLSNVRVAADERANTLVVTAPSDSMELIAALIEQMDRSASAEAELKVFTIANGDATSLAEMLETLFGTTEDNNEPGGFGAGGNGLVGLQLSVDQRTNSIIAAGTTEDLAVVEAILLRLDDSDVRERTTTVYRLKNSPAQDVATALNEWLQTERDVEQAADITVSPFQQIEREVIVVPEIVSNSLIVSATPRYYEDVRELIEKLDERPPMVMIQVLIAEVRLNDTDEFGIELGLQDSVLFDRSLLSDVQTLTTTTQQQSAGGAVTNITEQRIIAANNNPGFSFNNNPLGNSASSSALATASTVGAQSLSNFALNRTNGELGFGGFVLSASSNSVSFLLRALQESRRLEVLSRPQVMALDNQEGIVQVGQRVPRITQASLTQFGQTNSITYENVGIILRVIPRISPDGMVVMQVAAEKSEVGSEAEGIPISVANNGNILRAPRIDSTQAITTVSALSGQTIVLSGLMTKRSLDIHRRVPLLADIPLLGSLFRYDSVSEQRTELLIIMTPRIVKSELDAEMIKQVESSRMSWVLCDVINMHGPSGLRSRCDEWTGADAPTLYPTATPTEQELESGMMPMNGQPVEGTIIEGPIESSPGPLMESVPTPAAMGPTTSTKRAGSVSQVNYQRPATDKKSDTVYQLPPISEEE